MIRPPAELSHLASLMDAPQLLALLEAYGGSQLSVPRHVTARTALAGVVGPLAAKALSGAYGGERIPVPLAKRWRVRVYAERGDSVSAIARRLSMNRVTVQRALTARPVSDRQFRLF